ncbi:MAG TPA: ATP-binding protein, partial [Gemmatimonadales bacterium]|nr:ATP-binding protein [Gemmatimonadales bacterium]
YDESIHQILEDAGGRFWINTNRGVFWLPRAELQDFVAGRVTQVHSTSYTERDGLRNREGNGGYFPAGAKTGDGRLWFPTQDGVVAIDPRRLRPGALPPAVVERVVAGDSAFIADDGTITLDVTRRDLRIEYTASSFVGPANVRFRYRMEPYDRDWVDAGNRRVAFYTKVPPGRYRFRVEAGTGMGDWNEAGGATLALSLAARPWETTWFRALVLAFAGFLLGLAMRSRTRRLHRRADELELIVAERTSELSTRNTQLAQQTVQLAELDRAKTRFFANVSHEFRTPLTLTIGPLENLRTRAGDDGEAGRWIDLALRNARRLLRLVNQILDVAKLEAGQMRLAVRRFDLVPFARGVTAVFETAAAQRGITLRVDTPDSLIGVFDPDALEKIMTNLLSNAIKFTPRDGVVSVALVAEGPRICLAVKDTGPGIPDHQLEHVFERFYQADETTIRREPGTGIGLSLVKELVDLHGGTIAVESGNGHAGTTFTVLLPLEHGVGTMTPIIPPTPSKPEAVNRAEENGETPGEDDVPALLVVDDSEDLRVWIREHFARRFRVYEAADGAEGITLARQHLPDMVISDVMMPGTDGFALCRALREQPETDFLPIILLTAQAGSQQRIEGFERGADDYLTKPFEMRELEARVDNLIALRRRLRERYQREATETSSIVFRGQPTGLTPDDQALVSRIREAIEANLTNPDFGVAELAKAVFLDRSHLFRRSRELLDTAPSDLLRRARLERAARLLETGAGTVAEVAYAVGFNKVSHFCHLFQAAYGATPAAWRSRVEAK